LTPTPDLVNQTIMAAPILVLYLVSVLIIWLISLRLTLKKSLRKLFLDLRKKMVYLKVV